MKFEEALQHLKSGKRIYRKGWDGNGLFVERDIDPDTFYLVAERGENRVEWTPTEEDKLADDWNVSVEEDKTEDK